MAKYLVKEQMDDPAVRLKAKASDEAFKEYEKHQGLVASGKVKQPPGWVFIYDSETGEAKCFKGELG